MRYSQYPPERYSLRSLSSCFRCSCSVALMDFTAKINYFPLAWYTARRTTPALPLPKISNSYMEKNVLWWPLGQSWCDRTASWGLTACLFRFDRPLGRHWGTWWSPLPCIRTSGHHKGGHHAVLVDNYFEGWRIGVVLVFHLFIVHAYSQFKLCKMKGG